MDNCIVCLASDVDTFSRVTGNSCEWNENNIQHVIEKHFWWWYLKQSPPSHTFKWVCRQCWQELLSFHNFYLKVERVHKQYEFMKSSSFKNSFKANADIFIIKEEFKVWQTPTGNLTALEKCKNEITSETFENLQINEIPIAEIKYESDVNIDEFPDVDCGLSDILEPQISPENNSTQDDTNSTAGDKEEMYNKTKRLNKSQTKKNSKSKKPINRNRKKEEISKKSEISKRNDEFLAQSDFKLSCHICNNASTDFHKLKWHYRREHKIPGYVICCSKKFYKRGLLADHLRLHQNPNYFNCDKCNKSFFKKSTFDRHILSHVPDEERRFECDECDKKFATEYLARQHKSFTHLIKYAKICDVCGKSFRERFSFMRHMDEHNGSPPSKVPCDVCGAELTSKYNLNRHKKKMHTEENQQEQICPFCSKVSPNVHAHRQHINYAHTLTPKHACHMCDKKFKRPMELREHLSTHTGEPLYNCPHCPRTFISSGNMHKHRKLSHRKEWEEAKLKKLQVQQKLITDS